MSDEFPLLPPSAETFTVNLLRSWFKSRLADSDIAFGAEALTYDANSDYDILYYRLLEDARVYWVETYGYAPTPGQLNHAFFSAEYERCKEERASRRSADGSGDALS